MSLQDDVYNVGEALLVRADLRYEKPSLKENDPTYKAFQRIVSRLWQYETETDDAEKLIAAQNLLLAEHLSP